MAARRERLCYGCNYTRPHTHATCLQEKHWLAEVDEAWHADPNHVRSSVVRSVDQLAVHAPLDMDSSSLLDPAYSRHFDEDPLLSGV